MLFRSGGGAITDFESQKAEAAFARLNQAQSPEDFKAALDEFNSAVKEGVRKLEQQAGAAPQSSGSGSDIPEGVDPALWAVMTPEEKALWQR